MFVYGAETISPLEYQFSFVSLLPPTLAVEAIEAVLSVFLCGFVRHALCTSSTVYGALPLRHRTTLYTTKPWPIV